MKATVNLTLKEQIKDFILDFGKIEIKFDQNKRKRMPERSVTVEPSIWDKPSCRNFRVCGYINGKIMWCENGVSLDSAVCTVLCAAKGE